MSVSCEQFAGYTVTLKIKLTHDDFDFFNDFEEAYKEFSQWNHDGNKVKLIVDGMNGEYARLIYIDEHIENCWKKGKCYYPLQQSCISDDIYDELNKAYKLMYQKDLDRNTIEYALWFHFS